jgi:hypothetical protein
MRMSSFPVADLKEQAVREVQELEKRLREETGEEIVLIAYQREKTLQEGD